SWAKNPAHLRRSRGLVREGAERALANDRVECSVGTGQPLSVTRAEAHSTPQGSPGTVVTGGVVAGAAGVPSAVVATQHRTAEVAGEVDRRASSPGSDVEHPSTWTQAQEVAQALGQRHAAGMQRLTQQKLRPVPGVQIGTAGLYRSRRAHGLAPKLNVMGSGKYGWPARRARLRSRSRCMSCSRACSR